MSSPAGWDDNQGPQGLSQRQCGLCLHRCGAESDDACCEHSGQHPRDGALESLQAHHQMQRDAQHDHRLCPSNVKTREA